VKNTRILATYGPAIADPDLIRKLVESGVNLFRINCSHGGHDDFVQAAETIHSGTTDSEFPIGVLFDISGPKLRVERFDGEIELEEGRPLTLTTKRSDPSRQIVAVNHPAVIESLSVGDRVFMDDGQFVLAVTDRNDTTVTLRSLSNGTLTGGKGINLPGVPLKIPTITDKDREDIKTAVACKADYLALSFVRTPDDISEAKQLIEQAGGQCRVIAKLEKKEAIDRIGDIMDVADGVMVARGDLGVELPPEQLPTLQRQIIRLANQHRKPVIVATQMLESMRFNRRPTRAEVNDVASAVIDYVDAVMLSAETATGNYPLETVQMMARVIEATEESLPPMDPPLLARTDVNQVPQAIADAVHYTQHTGVAHMVFAFTASGYTAELISNLFSSKPIIALTPDTGVMSALSLYRSVYPVHAEQAGSFAEMEEIVHGVIAERNLVEPGDNVLITGGAPFGSDVGTNFMMISTYQPEGGTQSL